MTNAEVRREALRQLADRRAVACKASLVFNGLTSEGHGPTLKQVEDELNFLVGMNPALVEVVKSPLGGDPSYKITSAGILFNEDNP